MTFDWHGEHLEYFDHPYNATRTNERAVEIPIAAQFLERVGPEESVLEVGNVLAHYADVIEVPSRLVVDQYESAPGVMNEDLFKINGPFDVIVSVSTIEHIRWDELGLYRNPFGGIAALAFMQGLLSPGGRMIWTAGVGQNHRLDEFLYGDADQHGGDYGNGDPFGWPASLATMVRTRGDSPTESTWEVGPMNRMHREYGPTHGANAVWIGTVNDPRYF